MKGIILTIVSTLFLITNLFSQNRVWVTIPNIELASSELVNIVSFDKAFPSSKTRSLQDVYEIITNGSSETLINELEKRNDLFINPEVGPTYQTLETPNDYTTRFPNQWALDLINATSVWDITKSSSDITIAITDVNYYTNHEELIGKYNYVSQNYNSDYSHGTSVAVIAAGKTNNTLGTSSIGYYTNLQLRTMTYNEMLDATYSGAKIINCSWVASCNPSIYAQQVIDEVYNNGSVVVASAGNGSTCGGSSNLVYPASYEHVISVTSIGSSDNHERIVGNSSTTHQHNSMVDICAPGYDVPLTTAPGVYTTGSGTSFAAPFVSGTIALMLSVNPCLSVDDVEYILKESADTNVLFINPQYQIGSGRLNALKAVQMSLEFKTINGNFKEVVDCVSGNKTLSVMNLDGVGSYEYLWNNHFNTSTMNIGNDGMYKVEITDSLGCKFIDSIYVERYFKMTVQETKLDVLCFGLGNGEVSIDVLYGSNPELPVWNNGVVGRELFNLIAGDYVYSVIDGFGCEKIDTITINQPDKLISTITGYNPTSTTLGKVILDVVGGIQPYEFEWNNGSIEQNLPMVMEGFYEVQVTDRNGCKVSSNIILQTENHLGVNETSNDFKIYPNPSNGTFSINLNKTFDNYKIVSLSSGSMVTIGTSIQQTLNFNNLSSGVYIIYFQDGEEIQSEKITII